MKRLFFTALALVSVLVACSSDDDAATDDTGVVNVLATANNSFDPPQVTIKVGQTVRWTWRGGTHNVVSGKNCTREDEFKGSGAPAPGGTYEFTFEKAGTFEYFCELHCSMGMKGQVVVQEK
jgi:plastocyanin